MRTTNYDAIAATYDRRYAEEDYAGIERALLAFVGPQPDLRVLEVGCGTGHWLRVLADGGFAVTGLDLSWQMLIRANTAASAVSLIQARAERLPFAAGIFDRIFCINALHHFVDQSAFIAEARRVLRPNGSLMTVGLDPHTGVDRWWIYDYFDGTLELDRDRFPACGQIRQWLAAAGFSGCTTSEVQRLPAGDRGRWASRAAREALTTGHIDKTIASQLAILTDEEYQRGIAKICADLDAAESRDETLYLQSDLRLYATVGFLPSRR